MAMRIVIVDLHLNSFMIKPLKYMLTGRISIPKHSFFLNEAIKEGYEVVNYITGTREGCFPPTKLSQKVGRHIAPIVFNKNGYKNKIKNITDANEILEDDLVIFYAHLDDKCNFNEILGKKFINLNHFFSLRSEGHMWWPDIINKVDFDGYICEADVMRDSRFFQHYFPLENKKLLLLPYVAGSKFKKRKPFPERKNIALAMGSVGIEFDMYRDIYGTNQLHPMRREILNRKDENPDQIDCKIEEVKIPKPPLAISESEMLIARLLKRIYNHMYSVRNSPFIKNSKNAGYYEQDIVEIFNEYKMFIYPEEVVGVPALGFVEGMRCGCAYIGLDSPMYTKLGMKPGIHYIAYDGSYDDMIDKIRYYQVHERELAMIARNGFQFVRDNLNSEIVFKRFIKQFQDTSDEREMP